MSLLFPIRCPRPSLFATATFSNEEDRENAKQSWPWKKKQAMVDIFQHA
jgi:hypothetical protein